MIKEIENGMSGVEVRTILNSVINEVNEADCPELSVSNGNNVPGQYVSEITVNGHRINVGRQQLPAANTNVYKANVDLRAQLNKDGGVSIIIPELPEQGTLSLFRNGILLTPDVDYVLNENTITGASITLWDAFLATYFTDAGGFRIDN
jgi:hypothetical protein